MTKAHTEDPLLTQLRRAVARSHPAWSPPTWDHTFHFVDSGFTAMVIRMSADDGPDFLFVSAKVRIDPARPAAVAAALGHLREFLGDVGEPADHTSPGDFWPTWEFHPPFEWYFDPGPKREEA
jgi:hypothetical protein